MIKVTCEPQRYRITVEGHSKSAPKGEDLICAACTTIALTLAEMVSSESEDREIELREGFARIRGTKDSAAYFDFARTAFVGLASVFPEYVTLADKYS